MLANQKKHLLEKSMFVKYSSRHAAVIIVHESGKLGLFIISRKQMRETNVQFFGCFLHFAEKSKVLKTFEKRIPRFLTNKKSHFIHIDSFQNPLININILIFQNLL